jgi:hypothetical protein
VRTSRLDPLLKARVRARRPLFYAEGAEPALDRPAYVRAGSSLARFDGKLAIVQDDASFVALLDRTGAIRAVPLPAGPGGARVFDDARGNKKQKLDLEACVAVGDELWAFGSGSAPGRDVVVRLAPGTYEVSLSRASSFYDALRARTEFAGSELNVEGAVVVGDELWLFNRGNGAATADVPAIDAVVRVDLGALRAHLGGAGPVPELGRVEAFDLGTASGFRLTFTDATATGTHLLYLAAAEASPDATQDGPVAGVALGVLGEDLRHTILQDERGAPLLDKLEGIAAGEDGLVYAVADKDDPNLPCELLEIVVSGIR